MTTRKTVAVIRWTFAGKVMTLLFHRLSRLVITFLPKSKHLGRKAMANLDSILKSRDTTLLTKVHLVKAMVVPVSSHVWM